MKKKKMNKGSLIMIITIFSMLIILLCAIIYVTYENKDLEKGMQDTGYEIEENSVFYEKIETNNTMEDYYNDVKNNKDSKFIKYYVSKELDNFIELKMLKQGDTTITINIVNNFQTNKTEFNCEVKDNYSHLIIEGNSDDDYLCNHVLKENVNNEVLDYYCSQMEGELSIFSSKKEELLKNERIQKRINY